MGVWDVTTPAGSDNIRAGDDRIREMKVAIQEALKGTDATLGDSASFPGSAPTTAPEFAYRGHRGTTAQRTGLSADVSGLCFDTDTDKQALYSYAGGSWNPVATLIPEGTVMLFYQATAPTGWSEIDTPITDYFINATSVAAADGGSETSTFNNVGAEASHTHNIAKYYTSGGSVALQFFRGTYGGSTWQVVGKASSNNVSGGSATTGAWGPQNGSISTGYDFNSDAGSSHSHSHVQADHAYANVIICDKDAY